jgi:excisionase family DNA binding protein
VSVTLDDAEARVLAVLVARVLVGEAREHGARPTTAAGELLRRLTVPTPTRAAAAAPQWLSAAEAAERMGCSAQWVRRLAAGGRIKAERIGPTWSIRWPQSVSPPKPREDGSRTIAA